MFIHGATAVLTYSKYLPLYKTQKMFSVCLKSNSFLKNFASFKSKVQIITENKTYSTVSYVQGQSPESKIREYFYYIDHQGMVCR